MHRCGHNPKVRFLPPSPRAVTAGARVARDAIARSEHARRKPRYSSKMSPPPNSLAMRSSHPALAMWWEEMRRAEARQDVRSELFALNMVLKAYGPPRATFGAIPGFPVGMIVLRRMELCVLGLHRHFLSECSVTLQVRHQRRPALSPGR